ncbi:sensor protein EvgS precursor [Saccharicrinis fermentans DSM 9555 = JCM 21142]|uniref:histidine kinase n=2 Tax=Saccharicrinis fermentans TaxID=982 RepID=W7YKK8_9BACT|nr:sensor protein EvgS precursor [Saccharicrinis fermentans DSM 9555 = JCM 21142]
MRVEASLYSDIKLTILNADGINKKQNIQIQQLINMGVDLLIISPNESEPITKIAEEAYNRGIPTIIIDRKINSDNYTAYIGANNYEIGKNVAEYLGNLFSNQRKSILEIRGLDKSSPGCDRHQGFLKGLERHPHLQMKASEEGQWLPEIAGAIAMTKFKEDSFDIVFAHNDVMALGARKFAPKEQLSHLFFVGVDALPSLGIKKVYEGELQASFIYPTGGNLAIDLAIQILHHKPYIRINELETSVVDESNVKVIQLQQKQVLNQQSTINKQIGKIEAQNQEYNDQRTLLHVTLISLFLLVVAALWLAFYFVRINKKNHELAIKNAAIERQKKELEKKNEQILEMSKKVEDATQAKLTFFTNISHEIRTPLSLIQAPVRTMMTQAHKLNLPSSVNSSLNLIQRNTDRLLRMVNQLMDFRKVELGKADLSISKVNIIDECKHIYQSFMPLAQQKNIDFHLEKEETRYDVWIDVDKIDKVLFNLLSNAFKFTPKDGVIVIRIKTNHDKYVLIEISDSGPGISHKESGNIFEPFYQQSEHRSMGTGIGLSLSKGFMKLHHGALALSKSDSQGSIFTISIPKGKEHFSTKQIIQIQQEIKTTPETNNLYHNKEKPLLTNNSHKENTVLIVEDDIELREYLTNLLDEYFFVKSAENGKIALEMLQEEHPDIIVTDLMMPELNGIEMTKKIRSNLETCHLPLIMLTAKSTQDQKIEGIETGADAYIEKPFTTTYLLVRIRKLIESRAILREYHKNNMLNPEMIKQSNQNPLDKKFLSNLILMVESKYSDANFSVEECGRQLGLSRIHLYRKVKALTDYTPSEFINKYRLRKSKDLLLKQHSNINAVAFEVGFSSAAYFTKKFKEEYGMTPSQFIEQRGSMRSISMETKPR